VGTPPLRRIHDRWGISEHVDLDERDPGEMAEPVTAR
jgi:hypothetical protein